MLCVAFCLFKTIHNLHYEQIDKEVRCIEDELPFEIPDNWEWCKLESICTKLVDGDHNPPKGKSNQTNYLMCSSTNINDDKLTNLEKVRYLTKEVFNKENERTKCKKGDIFFTSVGSLGRSCIYEGNLNICFQRSVSVITTLIFNQYLKYYFDNPSFQNEVNKEATGTAQKGFYLNQLATSLIAIPPLNEQYRIVNKIKELESLIEKYKQVEEKLFELNSNIKEQLKKSILQYAIEGKLVPQDPNDEPASVLLERIRNEKEKLIAEGKIKKDKNESTIYRRDNSYYEKRGSKKVCIDYEIPFEIPNSWMWTRLKSLGYTQTGNTPSTSHQEYRGGYIPFITPGDIFDGIIDYKNLGLSEIGKDVARVCPAGSILQVCIGGSIGKAALSVYEVAFNQQINAISPVVVSNKYVLATVTSFMFLSTMKESAGGTATPILNRTLWDKMLIPLPPLSEQNRIVSMIEQLFPVVSTL